jgi:hypothetical protein
MSASDGHVTAHYGYEQYKFCVRELDSHHIPGIVAVVAAGGFFPDERGPVMEMDLGQKFGARREATAVD